MRNCLWEGLGELAMRSQHFCTAVYLVVRSATPETHTGYCALQPATSNIFHSILDM